MLMDEPFGAVDPIVRERLQNEFLRLQEELAKTILFVTHDIDEAIKMGDLVAVFQAGGVARPVRAAGRDPRQPGVRLRRPVRRRRTAASSACRLFRVGELPLSPVVTAPVGGDGTIVRRRRGGAAVRARPGHRRTATGRSAGCTGTA